MAEPTDHPFRDFLSTLRDEWERKTLLDFLRTEIDRQETESKRPGWTTWALFAAGAALISYLLSALEPAGANWHNIGVLFIFLSVATDCATFLANILRGKPEDQEQQRRFEFTSTYATDSRFFAVVMLLRMVFSLWCIPALGFRAVAALLFESRHVSLAQHIACHGHTGPFLPAVALAEVPQDEAMVGFSNYAYSLGRHRHRGIPWHHGQTRHPIAFHSGLEGCHCSGGHFVDRAFSVTTSASASPT